MIEMFLQKLCGLLMILMGFFSARITNDGTSALLLIPLGIWLTLSRNQLMTFNAEQKKKTVTCTQNIALSRGEKTLAL